MTPTGCLYVSSTRFDPAVWYCDVGYPTGIENLSGNFSAVVGQACLVAPQPCNTSAQRQAKQQQLLHRYIATNNAPLLTIPAGGLPAVTLDLPLCDIG